MSRAGGPFDEALAAVRVAPGGDPRDRGPQVHHGGPTIRGMRLADSAIVTRLAPREPV